MIEKVAETFALKRQFPIVGGLTTEEEIGIDINTSQTKDISSQVNTAAETQQEEKQPIEDLDSSSPHNQDNTSQNVRVATETPVMNPVMDVESKTDNIQDSEVVNQVMEKGELVQIGHIEVGETPSKVKFAKVSIAKENGQKQVVLAKGDDVSLVANLQSGQQVLMELVEENGFHFVKGVTANV